MNNNQQIGSIAMSEVHTMIERERSNNRVYKAVAIGLGVGALAVTATVAAVACHLSKEDDLHGAALVTATLATIGGGSVASGGDGMVGGLINLLQIGGAGVAIGSGLSVLSDSTSLVQQAMDPSLKPYL